MRMRREEPGGTTEAGILPLPGHHVRIQARLTTRLTELRRCLTACSPGSSDLVGPLGPDWPERTLLIQACARLESDLAASARLCEGLARSWAATWGGDGKDAAGVSGQLAQLRAAHAEIEARLVDLERRLGRPNVADRPENLLVEPTRQGEAVHPARTPKSERRRSTFRLKPTMFEGLEPRVVPALAATPLPVDPVLAIVSTPTNRDNLPNNDIVARFQFTGPVNAAQLLAEVGFGDGTSTTFGTVTVTPGATTPVDLTGATAFTLPAIPPGSQDPGFLTPPAGASISFFQELSAQTAVASGIFNFASTTSQFDPGSPGQPFDSTLLLGRLAGSTGANQPFVTIGGQLDPNTGAIPRGFLTLTFGAGRSIVNNPGDDLFLFELASVESFGVRATWIDPVTGVQNTTGFFSTPTDPFQYDSAPNSNLPDFFLRRTNLARIDFSDLGIPNGALVQSVEVVNLFPQFDFVTTGGQQDTRQAILRTDFNQTAPPGFETLPLPPGFNQNPAVSGPDLQFAVASNLVQTAGAIVTVRAPHDFPRDGVFNGVVELRDANGHSAFSTFTSRVSTLDLQPPFVLAPQTTGVPVVFPGGVLTTALPVPANGVNPEAQSYRAFIDWGDGTPITQGVVTDANNDGVLEISPTSFTYRAPGTYQVRVDLFSVNNVKIDSQVYTITVTGDPISGPVDPVAPQVVEVVRYGYHRQPTVVEVRFNTAMNPATVTNPANYQIVGAGADGRFGTRDDERFPVGRVNYNAATNTAILFPNRQLRLLGRVYRVTVSNLQSAAGLPLPTTTVGFQGLGPAGLGSPGPLPTSTTPQGAIAPIPANVNANTIRPASTLVNRVALPSGPRLLDPTNNGSGSNLWWRR